jgi:hypothetical protein
MVSPDNGHHDGAVEEFTRKTQESLSRAFTQFLPEMPRSTSLEGDDGLNEELGDQNRFVPFDPEKLDEALAGDRVEQPTPRGVKEDVVNGLIECIVETQSDIENGETKAFEYFLTVPRNLRSANSNLYAAVKNIVGANEDRQLECSVVALSACQDNQETLDGAANGLFTGNVLAVWDNGGFEGSYQQIHSRLLSLSESRPNITPAVNVYGGTRAEARLHERPFAI